MSNWRTSFWWKILVFKVLGKIFAIWNIVEFKFCNLKYDPEKSVELREYYPEVTPDYHINKI